MKRKLKLYTGITLASLMLSACAEKNVVLTENFDGETLSPAVKINRGGISDNKADVIGGKKSFVYDATKETKGHRIAFSITGDTFNVIELNFDYNVLDSGPYESGAPFIFFYSEDENGKWILCDSRRETRFMIEPKMKMHSKCVFHGYAGKKYKIEFHVHGLTKVAFDNIKIKGVQAPAKNDWSVMNAKEFSTCRSNPFQNHYLNIDDKFLHMSREEFYPHVDKYGQFKHRDWEDKIHCDEDFKKRLADEDKWLKKNPRIKNRDQYYGLIDPKHKYKATGRFRTEKVDGKWYMVTPEGNLFWSMGMCGYGLGNRFTNPTDEAYEARPNKSNTTPFQWREFMYEDVSDKRYVSKTGVFKRSYFQEGPADSFDFMLRNMEIKYGKGVPNKISRLKKRADSFGFNLGGHLSDSASLEAAKIPYTVTFSSPTHSGKIIRKIKGEYDIEGWWQTPPDWFDSNFEQALRNVAKKYKHRTVSPYCVGVFIDGELPWLEKSYKLAKGTLSCKPDQPIKMKFVEQLKNKYKTIDALNKTWKSSYASWDELLNTTTYFHAEKSIATDWAKRKYRKIEKLNKELGKSYKNWNDILSDKTLRFFPEEADCLADTDFLYDAYARRYFEVCRKIVKELDPNLMYLGCSFGTNGMAWDFAARISTEYCDIISANTYRFGIAGFRMPEGSKDVPVMIGEWHFANLDEGLFGPTMIPAYTRDIQCKYTKDFILTAIKNPCVVGANWFIWVDIPLTGRFDKADSGVGILDIADTPHYKLVEIFRDTAINMYDIRLNSKDEGVASRNEDRNWK